MILAGLGYGKLAARFALVVVAALVTGLFIIDNSVTALSNIDTPEAWAIIRDLRTRDAGAWQQHVDETLQILGKQLPP